MPASFFSIAVFISILLRGLNNIFFVNNSFFNLSNKTSSKYTKLPPIPITSGSKIFIKFAIPILKFLIYSSTIFSIVS